MSPEKLPEILRTPPAPAVDAPEAPAEPADGAGSVPVMPFIIGATMLLIVGAAIWHGRRVAANRDAAYTSLGRRLGLEPVTTRTRAFGLTFASRTELAGVLRGRRIVLDPQSTGSGKSRQAWTRASASCNPGGLKVEIVRRVALLRWIKVLAGAHVPTGDAAFDERHLVRTGDAVFARAALLPELRQQVAEVLSANLSDRIAIGPGRVEVWMHGELAGTVKPERAEQALHLAAQLAAAAEAYAQLRSVSPS